MQEVTWPAQQKGRKRDRMESRLELWLVRCVSGGERGDESGIHLTLASDWGQGGWQKAGLWQDGADNDFTVGYSGVSLRHLWGGSWRLALAFRIVCAEGMPWFLRTLRFSQEGKPICLLIN